METSAKNATNVEQAFMAMSADIKNRCAFACLLLECSCLVLGFYSVEVYRSPDFDRCPESLGNLNLCFTLMIISVSFLDLLLKTFFFSFENRRMASQPASNSARPPTVQIRGQPVAQKSGCCSS